MTLPDTLNSEPLIVAGRPVQSGELVIRHTCSDLPDSDKFKVDVSVADIAEPVSLTTDDDGTPAIAFSAYIMREVEGRYRSRPSKENARRLPLSSYDNHMRVPNLITDITEIESTVNQLMDRGEYERGGNSWTATTIGLTVLRPFMREIHLASGMGEIDTPFVDGVATDPQRRAISVSVVLGQALAEFMVLSPRPRQ